MKLGWIIKLSLSLQVQVQVQMQMQGDSREQFPKHVSIIARVSTDRIDMLLFPIYLILSGPNNMLLLSQHLFPLIYLRF